MDEFIDGFDKFELALIALYEECVPVGELGCTHEANVEKLDAQNVPEL